MSKHILGTEYNLVPIISEIQIKKKVLSLAEKISNDYKQSGIEEIFVIGVLKSSFIFISDIVRALDLSVIVDFVYFSSYKNGCRSGFTIKKFSSYSDLVKGKHVLIIEDILDSGVTLSYLVSKIIKNQPRSLKVCILLNKMRSRKLEVDVTYKGFDIPNKFVVGYGLDYNEMFRNLPYIAELSLEKLNEKR